MTDPIHFEKRDIELGDTGKAEDEARAYFKNHFGDEPFVFLPSWYATTGGKWRLSAQGSAIEATKVVTSDTVPRSDRRKYWETIHTLLKYVEKTDHEDALTIDEREQIAKFKKEHEWDGLSCSCGGGWLVGHLTGCPEAKHG